MVMKATFSSTIIKTDYLSIDYTLQILTINRYISFPYFVVDENEW